MSEAYQAWTFPGTHMDRATQGGGPEANPAYDALKQLILSCKLRPGERLIEAEIAKTLGMTRGLIHRAFDRLMIEELVDVVPRRGVIVRPVVIADLLQMVEVRRINEVYSARVAASLATLEQIDHINSVVRAASCAVETRDIETIIKLDAEFHRSLENCSKNYELGVIVSRLNERSSRFWFISSATQEHHRKFQSQHAGIVEALKARHPDNAERAMAEHIDSFRESLVRQICG